MTPQKNLLPPSCEGITLVDNILTCLHKTRMVPITMTGGESGKGFWACQKPKDQGSCKRYLNFDKVDQVTPLLPRETSQTPSTPSTQRRITDYYSLPTPSTGRLSESLHKHDGQDKENVPSRQPITPTTTRRTPASTAGETPTTLASTGRGIKRSVSHDASKSPPWKKQQSVPESGKDPSRRLFLPSTYPKRAATNEPNSNAFNATQHNENYPAGVPDEDIFGGKLSEGHVSSQTRDGNPGASPRSKLPLGDADSNIL